MMKMMNIGEYTPPTTSDSEASDPWATEPHQEPHPFSDDEEDIDEENSGRGEDDARATAGSQAEGGTGRGDRTEGQC